MAGLSLSLMLSALLAQEPAASGSADEQVSKKDAMLAAKTESAGTLAGRRAPRRGTRAETPIWAH
ncbi:MAG: hypothetical protein KC457_27115, partial [Myxococcales bacterium]|nr:hypothetical protein [Myxococcales bacterium]